MRHEAAKTRKYKLLTESYFSAFSSLSHVLLVLETGPVVESFLTSIPEELAHGWIVELGDFGTLRNLPILRLGTVSPGLLQSNTRK